MSDNFGLHGFIKRLAEPRGLRKTTTAGNAVWQSLSKK